MNMPNHWFLYTFTALLGTLSCGFLIFVNQRNAPDPVIESQFEDVETTSAHGKMQKVLRDGMIALRGGRSSEAEIELLKVQKMAKGVSNSQPEVIASLLGLATVYVTRNRIVDSDRALREALRQYNPNSRNQYDQFVINAFNGLADEYKRVNSKSPFRETCLVNDRIIRKLVNGDNADIYRDACQVLGAYYVNDSKEFEKAIPVYQDLVENLKTYHDPDGAKVASCDYGLGKSLVYCQRYREAAVSLRRALKLEADTVSHRRRLVATRAYLAFALKQIGEDAESAAFYQQAYKDYVVADDSDTSQGSVGESLANLAQSLAKRGNHKAAVELMDEAIILDSKLESKSSPVMKRLQLLRDSISSSASMPQLERDRK